MFQIYNMRILLGMPNPRDKCGKEERLFLSDQGAGKEIVESELFDDMDDGVVIGENIRKDFIDKPLYSRFSKTDSFKGVPQSIKWGLSPKPQQEIDESLYVYGKKGPQKPETSVSDDTFGENSVTTNEKVVSEPKPKEVEPREGYSFIKKMCFVCGSLSHLIRNCDFYEKKMAREAELKKQRVFNTGNGVAKPVWNNANRGDWGSAVKTSAGYNRRNTRPNSNCNGGPTFIRTDHPLKNMVDRGIFDSGCSGHMTGNKDQLEDFEEFNGRSVTFGGSKGYITGKGKIRHKVLFTETECLVVSSDFKMPDENQILLKVPRHHNMYSFDMKTPSLTKDYACLIAKATCDESKLWHRRLGHINFKNLNKLVKGNLQDEVFDVSSFSATDFEHSNGKQTPLSGCQEHHAVTPSQPSSSTLPVPTTSSPPVQSPPPIPTPIPTPTPTPTPTPIPATEPAPFEHTFEEPSPVHQHFSPP
ncbi:ribonuclease H-like domain-containing protein [Tanacetum coccineum]